MSKIHLGKNIGVDLSRLIETRMLIQANSGGGKSYAIRKLLEETHGRVQQIVLDMEGEFGTLREEFDYVLAGKGGDVDANPRTAELLARKVLELEVSLIVDLYELKKPERIRFVKNFIDAIVNSPKELWHPVLLVIDEAHVFVPEKGESEAAGAVIDLATRGRKRGFCAVLATQRISKLDKDVAAECLNKLIGRTSLDIDRKRAGDDLGWTGSRDSLALRDLEPGEFFAFGPAISNEIVSGKITAVKTTHPKAGQRLGFKRTKPTAHIKSVLKKLDDLPKEAEKEIQDKEGMARRIRELEMEIRKRPEKKHEPLKVDFGLIEKKVLAAISETKKEIGQKVADAIKVSLNEFSRDPKTKAIQIAKLIADDFRKPVTVGIPAPKEIKRVVAKALDGEPALGACERKILGFLAMKPGDYFTKIQIGTMTGYRQSGGFNNSLSKLTQMGLILRSGDGRIALDPSKDVSSLTDGVFHKLSDWVHDLGACERAIYEMVLGHPDSLFQKEELAEKTGYRLSGGFNNSLSRLNTLGLICRERGGSVRFNPEIRSFL